MKMGSRPVLTPSRPTATASYLTTADLRKGTTRRSDQRPLEKENQTRGCPPDRLTTRNLRPDSKLPSLFTYRLRFYISDHALPELSSEPSKYTCLLCLVLFVFLLY